MTLIKRAVFFFTTLAVVLGISIESAMAACNATLNGRPMTEQECALSMRVYGQVIPGDYLMDGYGNWVNANNPMHRGNTYRDANRNAGGSWGGRSYVSPNAVYDGNGGCEGGDCVNIID